MPKRPFAYSLLKGLEDERNIPRLAAISKKIADRTPDATAQIPGTGPEKVIYNYLDRLKIRFIFQYHMEDVLSTDYPENIYIPDFWLPDYNTQINVFGSYWHSMAARREKDLIQAARNLYAGRTVMEYGVSLPATGNNGKYVIWWEQEIYSNVGYLVQRDLPELLSPNRITGDNEHFLLDWKHESQTARNKARGQIASKMRPKMNPYERQLRAMLSKKTDLKKIYPFLNKNV